MMKFRNGLLLFLFSTFLVSCFDSPEFSIRPKIKFEDIYFGKARAQFKPDSLVISISFEDGDGDLGLDKDYVDEPYHEQNYFLANGGNLTPVGQRTVYTNLPPFLSIPASAEGKLVIRNTSRDLAYRDKMANYLSDSACIYYRIDSVLINSPDSRVIDESFDYYEVRSQNADLPPFFVVKDTFYVQRNPNYTNIDVRFFRKSDANSAFKEVNWYKELCTDIFTGRFPIVSSKENALSGTINFSMNSTQLGNVMNTGIWQIEVRIKDRALNVSEPVKSKEFTLQEIMR